MGPDGEQRINEKIEAVKKKLDENCAQRIELNTISKSLKNES